MEFFKGDYTEKKAGAYEGLLTNYEPFVMYVDKIHEESDLNEGLILDTYGLAQFIGFINKNEMHFVKMYKKYENLQEKQTVPTIQYNLVRDKNKDEYIGNYIMGPLNPNRNPILSSGKCSIIKIEDDGIVERVIAEGLKYHDEDLINSLLKRILMKKI